MESRTIDQLRSGYAAYSRGESVELFENVTDDFEARDRVELPDPQVHHGVAGAQAALVAAREDFDDYTIEPVELVVVGDCIVVHAHQTGRGRSSGALVEGDIFHVWRIRGDRVAGLRAFSTREEALADAESW